MIRAKSGERIVKNNSLKLRTFGLGGWRNIEGLTLFVDSAP